MTDDERNRATAAIFNTWKDNDPDALRAAASVVVDLAAIDPVVHHEVDHGEIDAWSCGCCGVEINGRSKLALEWSGNPSTFPHTVMCPWRRAAQLIERLTR